MDARLLTILALVGSCTGMSPQTTGTSKSTLTDTARVVTPVSTFNNVGLRDSSTNPQATMPKDPQPPAAPYQPQQPSPGTAGQANQPQQPAQGTAGQTYQPQQPVQGTAGPAYQRPVQGTAGLAYKPQQPDPAAATYPTHQQIQPRRMQQAQMQMPPPQRFQQQQQYEQHTQMFAQQQTPGAQMAMSRGQRGYLAQPTAFDVQAAKRYAQHYMMAHRTIGADALERMNDMTALSTQGFGRGTMDVRFEITQYPSYAWMSRQHVGSPARQVARAYLDEMMRNAEFTTDSFFETTGIMRTGNADKNVAFMATMDAAGGIFGDRYRMSARLKLCEFLAGGSHAYFFACRKHYKL